MTDTTERLNRAALRIREAAAQATPGPWRNSTTDGNRYGALVSDVLPAGRTPGCRDVEGYGGYLVGESIVEADRAHIALWNPDTALIVAGLLEHVAASSVDGDDLGAALHLADVILGGAS